MLPIAGTLCLPSRIAVRLAAWRLRAKLSSRPALVAGAMRRLGYRDRIGTGKRVLQSLIELLIELLLAFGLPLPALRAFVFGMWRQFGAVWPQRSVLVPFFHHGGLLFGRVGLAPL